MKSKILKNKYIGFTISSYPPCRRFRRPLPTVYNPCWGYPPCRRFRSIPSLRPPKTGCYPPRRRFRRIYDWRTEDVWSYPPCRRVRKRPKHGVPGVYITHRFSPYGMFRDTISTYRSYPSPIYTPTHGRSPASGGSRWGNASRTPIVRQAMPKDDGSIVSPKRGHFFLAHWSKSGVYAYIRHHRLKGFPHTWGSSQPHSHPAQHYNFPHKRGRGLVTSCKSGWLFSP